MHHCFFTESSRLSSGIIIHFLPLIKKSRDTFKKIEKSSLFLVRSMCLRNFFLSSLISKCIKCRSAGKSPTVRAWFSRLTQQAAFPVWTGSARARTWARLFHSGLLKIIPHSYTWRPTFVSNCFNDSKVAFNAQSFSMAITKRRVKYFSPKNNNNMEIQTKNQLRLLWLMVAS